MTLLELAAAWLLGMVMGGLFVTFFWWLVGFVVWWFFYTEV